MVPGEHNDENLEVGVLIVKHVLFHRREQKLTEASFVASHFVIENRVILLFLRESPMLSQPGRIAWSFTCMLFRELKCFSYECK